MKLSILAGATSQSINVFLQDSTSTTGGGKTGLVFNTATITAYYTFAGANATSVSISLVTLAAVTTAWTSGGFKEIDSTNMPGWYRLDVPNAMLATSKGRSVALHIQGVTGLAPAPIEIELTGIDNQDAVHGGMSALPNTAVTTNASLLTSGTGTDQISVSAGKLLLQATQTGVTIPTVTTVGTLTTYTGNTVQTGDSFARLGAPSGASIDADILAGLRTSGYTAPPTVAAIATAVWQDATAGDFTTASSIGKALFVSAIPGAAGGHFIAGTNAATVITTSLTTHLIGTVDTVTTVTNQLTAAAIATGLWQDTTAGDFTVAGSPGQTITQLDGTFTTGSSSIFSTASLANAPTGGSAPTAAAIATAIFTDLLTSSDFSTASSIGALLKANTVTSVSGSVGSVTGAVGSISGVTFPTRFSSLAIDVSGDVTFNNTSLSGSVGSVTGAVGSVTGAVGSVTGAVGSVTGNVGGNVVGSTASVTGAVGSVTAPVVISLTETLNAARALDAIADTSLTVNDALHCAVASIAAQVDASSGTSCIWKTASTGTTLRTKTLTLISPPSTVPDKAV